MPLVQWSHNHWSDVRIKANVIAWMRFATAEGDVRNEKIDPLVLV